jgi:hypothetical protein
MELREREETTANDKRTARDHPENDKRRWRAASNNERTTREQ